MLQEASTHAALDDQFCALGGVILVVTEVEGILLVRLGRRWRRFLLYGGDDPRLTQHDLRLLDVRVVDLDLHRGRV